MPYIKGSLRPYALVHPVNSGELNFKITTAIVGYVYAHGLSYTVINDVIGALECAKQEFLRRIVAPYEDGKILDNGDVYPAELL